MENNNIYYNYVYMDPRKPGDYNYGPYHFDYEPFYVGKGSNGRYREKHRKECEKLLEEIISDGFEFESIYKFLHKDLAEDTALANETKLIQMIGKKDMEVGPLLNKRVCDTGKSGRIVTKETRQKISEANKGRKHTDEWKRKMSESMKGKKPYNITDEIRKKMSESHKGKKHTEETKQKHREIMIERYKDPNERRKTGEASKLALSDPKIRQKISEKTKIGIQKNDTKEKRSERGKISNNRPEIKKKISEGRKKYWSNPENRKKASELANDPIVKRNNIDKNCKFTYIMTSPGGDIYIVKSMREFCRENNLIRSDMLAVMKGKRKHHKGWKCKRELRNEKL